MNTQKVNFNFGSVQTALKQQRESIGKDTHPCHYMNEIGLIRYAMTGNFKTHFDLKNLNGRQRWIGRRVICLNRRLIRLHVRFKDRKQACREFVLKHQAKT
uniref:hypothetical protein n=1 Tax=Limnohabitans sp. TaxID=1907725 RepID=UPI004048B25F